MKIRLYFTFIVLMATSAFLYASEKQITQDLNNSPKVYEKAVETYEKKEYSSAKKQFKNVIKKHPKTKWEIYSRIYIARCWRKTGNFKKSLKELDAILKKAKSVSKSSVNTVLEEIGKIGDLAALDKLKNLMRMSTVSDIRKKSAQVIGNVAKKIDAKEIKKHIEFMVESLKSEKEMAVAREISNSIYKIGEVNSDKIINIYKNADNFLKKKIIYLMSKYDDEDLIMVLQEDSEKSKRSSIRTYVSWALAKMDPYRFAVSYKGKLKKEDNIYRLRGRGFNVELFKPSLKREKIEELEKFINKNVVVYGVEVENGIIYTDIFKNE